MYIIRNNTKGKVVLGDINMIVNFNEEIDLDKRLDREVITKSAHLKYAIDKYLLILVKDVDPNPPKHSVTTIFTNVDNSQQLAEMEERLRSHFADELKKINKEQKPTENIDEKINLILDAVKAGGPVQTVKNDTDVEFEGDDEKMAALHQKVIDRITKNSSAKIQSEENEVKDSGLSDKADELEGLI